MSTLLYGLALVALQGDLPPLPEEKGLESPARVVLEFARLEAGEAGLIGWTKTTVERAQMEGATHYLVHRFAEIANFETLGLTTMESRGLYDSDLNLVHELRSKRAFGDDAKPLEMEWGDEGFRWRTGRGRWNPGTSEIRPTATTDVALMVHGLSVTTPWKGQVFDDETEELQAQTLQPGTKTSIDDENVIVFEVQGPTPMRHVTSEAGIYLRSTLGELRIKGIFVQEETELALRRALADSALFEQVLARELPSQWSEKSGTFSNPALDMSLKLPEGWRRATAKEVDGTHFHAFSEDSNAYVSLAVTVLGSGYTLDGWSEGLLEVYTEVAVDGAVRMKKQSFAKQNAISIEFVRAGDALLDSKAYAWERNGLGFVMIGGTWDEGSKKLHRETSGVLKSVKFTR